MADLNAKLNIDVSEAITGLKAVQREAREATKALRELEAAREGEGQVVKIHAGESVLPPDHVKKYAEGTTGWTSNGGLQAWFLSQVPTHQIADELSKREGVEEYVIDAHGGTAKIAIDNGNEGAQFSVEGPARIVVNRD